MSLLLTHFPPQLVELPPHSQTSNSPWIIHMNFPNTNCNLFPSVVPLALHAQLLHAFLTCYRVQLVIVAETVRM